ncbi:hypothetical protein B566_EDAN001772 [Ephemera danica]|nr:hypothetical protein B566_EDAN001772 [Ephemera danica]
MRVSSSERAGRFIALGSSGELLPISRNDLPMNHPRFTVPRHSLIGKQPEDVVLPVPPSLPGKARSNSEHSKRTSSSLIDSSEEEEEDDDEFHSAKESLDLSEDGPGPYGHQLDTPQRRCSFAQRLREALRREASALGVIDPLAKEKFASLSTSSSSSEAEGSSYAVGISVSGSDVIDRKYKVRRGGSCGFALPEDQDLRLGRKEMDPLGLAPAKWLGRALSKDSDSNDDSNVSQHDSEYSSDLEELYEHFSRWLEHDKEGEEQAQEEAVRNFARGLLTRTLSDCGLIKSTAVTGKGSQGVTRSLSEAAGSAQSRSNAPRRLAAHLASLLGDGTAGPRPVATGSWWGGHSSTDPQLKAVLQWLAASQAQSSCLLYYTDGVNTLAKLDTLCRVIVDRQWSVGELTSAVLRFAQTSLDLEDPNLPAPTTKRSLFDELIGTDKPVVTLETEL